MIFARSQSAVPSRLVTDEPLRIGPVGNPTLQLRTPDGRMVVAEIVRGYHQDAPALARLLAASPALLGLLRRVEWGGADQSPDPDLDSLLCCPICDGVAPGQGAPAEVTGHDEECELRRTLAFVEGGV